MRQCSTSCLRSYGANILAKNNFVFTPHIQFLAFDGCPLADAARSVLENALRQCGLEIDHYEAINILDPSTPTELASWGSPSILVNGRDVTGQVPGDGVGCRLYFTPDQVPTLDTIATAIMNGFDK